MPDSPAPLRLRDLRSGPVVHDPARAPHVQRTRGHGRALCSACQGVVRDRLMLDPAGRVAALADPNLLTAASAQTRAAVLGALIIDRGLWPVLLERMFAEPALRRLALERLRRELTG